MITEDFFQKLEEYSNKQAFEDPEPFNKLSLFVKWKEKELLEEFTKLLMPGYNKVSVNTIKKAFRKTGYHVTEVKIK